LRPTFVTTLKRRFASSATWCNCRSVLLLASIGQPPPLWCRSSWLPSPATVPLRPGPAMAAGVLEPPEILDRLRSAAPGAPRRAATPRLGPVHPGVRQVQRSGEVERRRASLQTAVRAAQEAAGTACARTLSEAIR